jgi:hypothetical protein
VIGDLYKLVVVRASDVHWLQAFADSVLALKTEVDAFKNVHFPQATPLWGAKRSSPCDKRGNGSISDHSDSSGSGAVVSRVGVSGNLSRASPSVESGL